MNVLGPLLVSVAAWCAAGSVAVASSASTLPRIGAAAPWWVLIAALALAAAVRPWRERPLTALPAALAILPWLPIPLPVVALIWTGPMAWVPIALAFALAVGLTPLRVVARTLNLLDPDDATAAACVLALCIGGLSAWSTDLHSPEGDEPHYLVITQSLLLDGDLDIDNNHARHDYKAYYDFELNPDLRRRGVNGQGYSIHAPGVSAIVAPAFQIFGYTGARVTLLLLTALGAMLTWRLAWRATDSAPAAWCGWAAVMLTPTFALQSYMVFPDAPGFLAVAVAGLLIVRLARGDMPGMAAFGLTGVALAALPWMHSRFAILAAGLGAVIVLRVVWPGEVTPRQRDGVTADLDLPLVVTRAMRVQRLVAFLAVPVISAALWFWFFKVLYGTYDPRAPYPLEAQNAAWIVPAILALFFDSQFGLAAYSPAVALVFLGWWRRTETFTRRLGLELALVVFMYLAIVTTVRMWWAGRPATPARFMMALLPLLAAPIAVWWTRASNSARALSAGLIAAGGGITAYVVTFDHGTLLWSDRTAVPQWLEHLAPLVNMSRAWPSFFWDEPRFPLHVALWLGLACISWAVIVRIVSAPRAAATVWALVMVTLIAPLGWQLTGTASLDAAPAQLNVIRLEGEGRRVYAISQGHVAALRSLRGTMTMRPLEPPTTEWGIPPLLAFDQVPAARYIAKVRSTSPKPLPLRLRVGLDQTPWRVFDIPGAGEFSFPFLVPGDVPSLALDTNPDDRGLLRVELLVEDAVPSQGGITLKSAAHYGTSDVLFLDDHVFVEDGGFWVQGRQAATVTLVAGAKEGVTPLTSRVLFRNGGTPNNVAVESGTFQRLLTMAPFEEKELDIPLTPGGMATVRIASGEGFVPAEREPGNGDRRLLGVWVQPR